MTCGVSNVSFGLKPAARVVLNSVFLHELVEAGMTSAIVHASKILPLNRIPDDQQRAAMDLLYDRRHASKGGTGLPEGVTDEDFDPLQAFIALFKDVESTASTQVAKADLTLEEQLRASSMATRRASRRRSIRRWRSTRPWTSSTTTCSTA